MIPNERSLGSDPHDAEGWHQRGMEAFRTDRLAEAQTAIRVAADLLGDKPESAELWTKSALIAQRMDRHDEAVAGFERSFAVAAASPGALNTYAISLEKLNRLADAAAALRRSLALNGRQSDTQSRLAEVLRRLNRTDEAAVAFRAAAELNPSNRSTWGRLGGTLAALGLLGESLKAYRRLVSHPEVTPSEQSDFVMFSQYDADSSSQDRFDIARAYGRRHTDGLRPIASPDVFCRDRSLDARRVLRIGYVSGDFKNHPVGRLIEPPLAEHDRGRFTIVCYSDVREPDDTTRQLRALADEWKDVFDLSHERLAQTIYDDRIDVLVELCGHFGGNRLPAMGHRPAPVQMSAFGYCATTGVSAIDYRITDIHSDPLGTTDAYHVERLLRLPHCTWCYRLPGVDIDPGPAPSVASGRVTLANLNNAVKTTEAMAAVWTAILRKLPHARLMLLAAPGTEWHARQKILRHGANADQVVVVGPTPRHAYLERFRDVDIALDPFPFNGDNTTCDALWMGVPVVSLVGDSFASRRGLSHLLNVGLEDLAVQTTDEYVRATAALAADESRRATLRATLRERLSRSVLGDGPSFVRELEQGYRDAWTEWVVRVTTSTATEPAAST